MLHMMTVTHGPDTCAATVPEIMEMAMDGLQKMGEVAKSLDITVQGSWANMPAHVIYVVVDAPNAHVVNRLARETKLMNWNTVAVSPIITLDEAVAAAAAG
jgi:hypothetical protein